MISVDHNSGIRAVSVIYIGSSVLTQSMACNVSRRRQRQYRATDVERPDWYLNILNIYPGPVLQHLFTNC